MKTRADVAEEKMLSGYNCAQAVLFAFCEDLGLDRNTALKLATGFGAGMARKQEVCGAVSGGIFVVGLRHGRGEGEEKAVTEDAYRRVRELLGRFEREHGSCLCKDLVGCDLNTPEGQCSYRERDCLHKTCVCCVRSVVEAVETLL
ncbi:MAG: C-GCAxxG-C-C family protein [Chthoniobacteraceae bacterium]|nr:C-GCAxxG-C-C family protein [Chthoniobacteraceae bacterium]